MTIRWSAAPWKNSELVILVILRVLGDLEIHPVRKLLFEVRRELSKYTEGNSLLCESDSTLDDQISECLDALASGGLVALSLHEGYKISSAGTQLLAVDDIHDAVSSVPALSDIGVGGLRSMDREVATPPSTLPTIASNFATCDVLFVTDRTHKAGDCIEFIDERSIDGELSWGKASISIPRDHRLGHLESPSMWKLEFRPDPSKHIVLSRCVVMSEASFYDAVAASASDAGDAVLLFIHGFNVTFADALRRAAQLAYDLGHNGTTISFSWPSKGRMTGYLADEATVEWSAPHLASVVERLLNVEGKSLRINVVAHSMGGRLLLRAMEHLQSHPPKQFGEVVFAAPDVDRQVFEQVIRRVRGQWRRATLYANSHDEALRASRVLHQFPRAGDSIPEIVVCAGIESIDATNIVSSLVGHGYFGDNQNIMSDLFYLIKNAPMPRFRLVQRGLAEARYWEFSR